MADLRNKVAKIQRAGDDKATPLRQNMSGFYRQGCKRSIEVHISARKEGEL